MTGAETVTVAKRSTPWSLIAVVGLIIAKMGFGVQIAWLWVFAPIWIPIVLILGIILVPVILFAIFAAVVLLWAVCVDAFNRRRRRPSIVGAR